MASPSDISCCFHHSANPLRVKESSKWLYLERIVFLYSFSSLMVLPMMILCVFSLLLDDASRFFEAGAFYCRGDACGIVEVSSKAARSAPDKIILISWCGNMQG